MKDRILDENFLGGLIMLLRIMRDKCCMCFTFILMILLSCNENKDENINHYSLKGTRVSIDSFNLDKEPLLIYKDFLISAQYRGNRCFLGGKLTQTKWQKSDSLFLIGNGHNEFHELAFAIDNNYSLYLLDYPSSCNSLLSLTHIPATDSIDIIKNGNMWEKYNLSELPAFKCFAEYFVPVSDSTILVPGTPYKEMRHIMSLIDFKNKKITPLEYWPNDNVECDSFPKHSIYTDYCKIFGNSNGKYIYVCGRERFSFIFSIDGNKINVIKELYSIFPNYTSDESKINYIIKSRNPEQLFCTTNTNNIYMLLTDSDKYGKKLEKWENPYICGNTIDVYNWNGEKQRIIHLDKYGQKIFVSNDNKKLYLFVNSYDGCDLEIYSYDLSVIK